MIPVKLTLNNFISYGETEPLDFSQIHIACLSGPNGNGKSAMLDGITWAIWGYARGKSDDDLIRLGTEEMFVELEFELEDNLYRVIRKRTKKGRGKSDLQLQMKAADGFVAISGSTLKETQAKIIDILKMDYATFINSACILQGRSDEFTNSTPGERKEVLSQVLGLSRFDKLQEKAKDKLKEISIVLDKTEADIAENEQKLLLKDSIQEQLAAAEVLAKNLEAEIFRVEKSIKELQKTKSGFLVKQSALSTELERIKEFEKVESELAEQCAALKKKKERFASILASKDSILQKSAELELMVKNEEVMQLDFKKKASLDAEKAKLLSEYERTLSAYQQEESKRSHQLEIAKTELKNIKDRSILLGPADCKRSDCSFLKSALEMSKQIAPAEQKVKSLMELPELKKPEFPARIEQIDIEIEMLDYSEETHRYLKNTIENYKQWVKAKPELDQAETVIKDLDEQLGKISGAQKDLAEKKQALSKKQADLIALESAIDAVDYDLSQKEKTIPDSRDRIEVFKQDVTRARLELDNLKKTEGAIKAQKERISAQSKEKILYVELEKAFSRNGIPALLIDNAIPQIEEEANIILSKITEGKLKVQLSTQKDLKTGGTAETLDILISDDLGTRVYEMYSGGEAFRVNFALRIALSKILAYRSGAKLQTLIIDEGFGTQDMDGVIRLKEIINGISADFKKILIITHIQEFKNAFPVRIEIEKDPVNGSKFKVIEN